jgi:hypothetical protein
LETTKWFYIWWYTYPTEEYDFVSWDDEIPNIWKFNLKKNVPNHQPDMLLFFADPDYY